MWNIVQHDGPNHLETWLIPGWHRVVMGHMHGQTETLIAVLARAGEDAELPPGLLP